MPLLKYSKNEDILKIYLDDLQSQNSLSLAMAEELAARLAIKDFSGLIVTNNGNTFCAGGNLRFYKDLQTKEEGLAINRRITRILDDVFQLPIPKACFVNGPCYGGGIEFLACFDFVVASPRSLFGLWQRRVGLSLGWGGETRLERRMSKKQLNNWLLRAETISVFSAKNRGLIDDIQLSSSGLETCDRWVRRSLSFGTESLTAIQQNQGHQDKAFAQLWLSETHKKVLDKF